MAGAWPLRYAAVAGDVVVVAGSRGLAHTSIAHLGAAQPPKWRSVRDGGKGKWRCGEVLLCEADAAGASGGNGQEPAEVRPK